MVGTLSGIHTARAQAAQAEQVEIPAKLEQLPVQCTVHLFSHLRQVQWGQQKRFGIPQNMKPSNLISCPGRAMKCRGEQSCGVTHAKVHG